MPATGKYIFTRLENGNVEMEGKGDLIKFPYNTTLSYVDKFNIRIDGLATYYLIDYRQVAYPDVTSSEELLRSLSADFFFDDREIRIKNLEDVQVIVRVYDFIGTAQTGQVEIFEGTQIQTELFEDGVDAIPLEVDSQNRPIEELATTASGDDISVDSFDSLGNYTLSDVPGSDSAIRYFVRTTLANLPNIPLLQRDYVTFIQPGSGEAAFEYIFNVVDPQPTDDTYAVGARWINTATKDEWILLDNTDDNAVWKKTTTIDENGNIIIDGTITINGAVNYGGAVIVEINSNVNNLTIPDIGSQYLVHIESTGSYYIAGIVPNDITKIQPLEIYNTGSNNWTFRDNSPLADANNRFLLGNSKNVQPDEGLKITYDTIDTKWRSPAINI